MRMSFSIFGALFSAGGRSALEMRHITEGMRMFVTGENFSWPVSILQRLEQGSDHSKYRLVLADPPAPVARPTQSTRSTDALIASVEHTGGSVSTPSQKNGVDHASSSGPPDVTVTVERVVPPVVPENGVSKSMVLLPLPSTSLYLVTTGVWSSGVLLLMSIATGGMVWLLLMSIATDGVYANKEEEVPAAPSSPRGSLLNNQVATVDRSQKRNVGAGGKNGGTGDPDHVNSSRREPPLLFVSEKSDDDVDGAPPEAEKAATNKEPSPPEAENAPAASEGEPAPPNPEAEKAAAHAGVKLEFIGTLLLAFAAALSPNAPLVLAALVYMTGGHLNPAVTTVLALTGNLPEASSGFICGVYPIIQIIAAIGGNMIAGLFISSRAASPDAPPSIPKAGGTGGLVLRESSCGPRPSPPVEFRREVVGARGPLPYRMHGIMSSSHD